MRWVLAASPRRLPEAHGPRPLLPLLACAHRRVVWLDYASLRVWGGRRKDVCARMQQPTATVRTRMCTRTVAHAPMRRRTTRTTTNDGRAPPQMGTCRVLYSSSCSSVRPHVLLLLTPSPHSPHPSALIPPPSPSASSSYPSSASSAHALLMSMRGGGRRRRAVTEHDGYGRLLRTTATDGDRWRRRRATTTNDDDGRGRQTWMTDNDNGR